MANTDIISLRKKEGRGIFLTTILLVHSLIAVYLLYIFIVSLIGIFIYDYDFHSVMMFNSAGILALSITVVMIISVPFLWRWSKIGIYALFLLVALCVVLFLLNLPLFLRASYSDGINPIKGFILSDWPYFVIAFLYFWAIKRKWRLFI